MPKMIPVASSTIDSVGYDQETQTLTVRFYGGREYDYSGVPADIYEELLRSPSPGTTLNNIVKDHYPHRRAV